MAVLQMKRINICALKKDRKPVLELLQRVCREEGVTIIVVTHNQAITPMADRVISVKNSRIAANTVNPSPRPVQEIEW